MLCPANKSELNRFLLHFSLDKRYFSAYIVTMKEKNKTNENRKGAAMRRTQSWVDRVVAEGWAEVEWEGRTWVQVRWNHNNVSVTVWVV